MRELGGAGFIFAKTGYCGINFCENWVARNLFLQELGVAEFIFANWLPTP